MKLTRRDTIIGSLAAGFSWPILSSANAVTDVFDVPKIGMGTWLTFDVNPNGPGMEQRGRVLDAFFAAGGGMIDSSPMYGEAEAVMGKLMTGRDGAPMFSATKIWSAIAASGPTQLATSHRLWGEEVLDLVYVHNLLQWPAHMKTLRAAKESGKVRYIGMTTSHGRRHDELERLMTSEPMDAVQFSYNVLNRRAENRLLPTATDNNLAVIINRPFMSGALFDHVKGHDVPDWAKEELNVDSWAAYFLKFVISHPAVTCAIPATRNPDHMRENMAALNGPVPDAKQRLRMITSIEAL